MRKINLNDFSLWRDSFLEPLLDLFMSRSDESLQKCYDNQLLHSVSDADLDLPFYKVDDKETTYRFFAIAFDYGVKYACLELSNPNSNLNVLSMFEYYDLKRKGLDGNKLSGLVEYYDSKISEYQKKKEQEIKHSNARSLAEVARRKKSYYKTQEPYVNGLFSLDSDITQQELDWIEDHQSKYWGKIQESAYL